MAHGNQQLTKDRRGGELDLKSEVRSAAVGNTLLSSANKYGGDIETALRMV